MLRYFSAEEQQNESEERDAVVSQINTYNRRYSGQPVPVTLLLCAHGLIVSVYCVLLSVVAAVGSPARFADVVAASRQRVLLSGRTAAHVSCSSAHDLRLRPSLLSLAF